MGYRLRLGNLDPWAKPVLLLPLPISDNHRDRRPALVFPGWQSSRSFYPEMDHFWCSIEPGTIHCQRTCSDYGKYLRICSHLPL